ncbi:hypothetical protein NQ317_001564 [Molorchus minor]|uniref:Uncharacterized protein n=1 Tax=Molorchus minor TaxID=1323400 RepID=A0ABQ9J5W5_9CUCU|nr:hypothetical protein NQ317_001564 [Molorchus minor]
MQIMLKLSNSNKFKRISHKLGILFSSIICDCAKDAYGNVWNKMDMLNCPPWSCLESLKRFKKYWGSVFREKLLKHFYKPMEELLSLLQTNKLICDDSQEFITFMDLSITLCIFLKDIEESRGFVENTLNEVTKIASARCTDFEGILEEK